MPDLVMLATKADAYKELRTRRLQLQREVDVLKEQERGLKADLLAHLEEASEAGVSTVGGATCRVSLVPKQVVQVTDWDALFEHIQSTGEFELLQRRVGQGAVKERWDHGASVPGVERTEINDLSVRSL